MIASDPNEFTTETVDIAILTAIDVERRAVGIEGCGKSLLPIG